MKQIEIPCKKKLFKHDFEGVPPAREWVSKNNRMKDSWDRTLFLQRFLHDVLFEIHQLFDANRGFRYEKIEIPEIEPNEEFSLVIDGQLFAVCNYQIVVDLREPFLYYIYFEYRKLNMHFFHPIKKPFR